MKKEELQSGWPGLLGESGPLYKRLADSLEAAIKNGELGPGSRLPPQRELADSLGLNLSTVTRAFNLCGQKGLISARVGQGTFVSADAGSSAMLLSAPDDLIEMGAAHPVYAQNRQVLDIMRGVLDSPAAERLLEYRLPGASPAQQAAAACRLFDSRVREAFHIHFAAGGQNAIFVSLLALCRPGDRFGADPLTYPGVKLAAANLGVQLVPVPWEAGEMSPDALNECCRRERLKGVYLTPDCQNPTGRTMRPETRRAIAAVAQQHGIALLEDGINRFLPAAPLPSLSELAPDCAVHIFSLSKAYCAGLRVAVIGASERYSRVLQDALYAVNLIPSPYVLEVARRLFELPEGERILDERRRMTEERCRIADAELATLAQPPLAISNFRWLSLPAGWSGHAFEAAARQAGVQVYGAERFAVGKGEVLPAVRICVTAPADEALLRQGLRLVRGVLESPPPLGGERPFTDCLP